MQFLGLIIIFLFTLLPYSTSLKCHYCSGYDYLPANVQAQLNIFNISLDDIDTTELIGNCKSYDDSCSNSTWCAKKTAEYKIHFNGVKYTYRTYYKTCGNNDTQTEIGSGKCYNTSVEPTKFEGGITRSISWCYCNDKDYCNNSITNFVNASLLIMVSFILN